MLPLQAALGAIRKMATNFFFAFRQSPPVYFFHAPGVAILRRHALVLLAGVALV